MKPANTQVFMDHDHGDPSTQSKWSFSFQISWILWISDPNTPTDRPLISIFYIYYRNVILFKLLYGRFLFHTHKHFALPD